jgi:hypothetical protein
LIIFVEQQVEGTSFWADSRPTTQQITTLIEQLSKFFPEQCATYIQKFVVNSKEIMLRLPKEDRIEALREDSAVNDIFEGKAEQPPIKILGISWVYVADIMFFDFTDKKLPLGLLEKLKMLQILHTLYDPQ